VTIDDINYCVLRIAIGKLTCIWSSRN